MKFHELLTKKYPSLMSSCYDCSPPVGWFKLVEHSIDRLAALELDDLKIFQVKEKFGELRIYCNNMNRQSVEKIITDATTYSLHTCQECSRFDLDIVERKVLGGHWLSTLCNDCRPPDSIDDQIFLGEFEDNING